jgi:predicted transcriptional regulator
MVHKENDDMATTGEVWSLRLPPEDRQKIDAIAKRLERSRHWVVKRIIETALKSYDEEDALVRTRLELSERPDAEFIDHDEAMGRIEAMLSGNAQ